MFAWVVELLAPEESGWLGTRLKLTGPRQTDHPSIHLFLCVA